MKCENGMRPPITKGLARPPEELNFGASSSEIAKCMIIPGKPECDWQSGRKYQRTYRANGSPERSRPGEVSNLEDHRQHRDPEQGKIRRLHEASGRERKPGPNCKRHAG